MSDRPDVIYGAPAATFDVVEAPLSAWRKIWDQALLRKIAWLVLLAVVWEGYARRLSNPLLFPTFADTVRAFF